LLGLEVFVSYRRYSQMLRWLTLSLGTYIAVLLVVKVDWAEVARNVFIPSIHLSRGELVALIAVFGTTISPYLFFWQASEEVEEEREHHESNEPLDRTHLRAMRVDVVAGMTSAVAVMFAIMVASAATLHGHGITTIQTADQAARALRPIAGPVAGLLFALGIVGTGSLAVPVLAGSSAYAVAETFGWPEGLSRSFRKAFGFYGSMAAAMLVGLVLGFVGVNPIRALYYSAILNGLAAPPLILLMLILSRTTKVCGSWRGGTASTVLLIAALVVMAGLPIAYLVV